ncbi:MAG: hypothetical protein LBI28_10390 [Treponema sp.]|nr:hypothetical protein [Treponema sp.]
MPRLLCIVSIFIFSANVILGAQEHQAGQEEQRPRWELVLDINARVLENEQDVIWSESTQKITRSGNSVTIQLVGSNVVVAAQFTPYIRRQGSILAAQGQIWVEDPGRGISYYTSIQTIPMEFNEPIYFVPLGTSDASNLSIEIILTINPRRAAVTEDGR